MSVAVQASVTMRTRLLDQEAVHMDIVPGLGGLCLCEVLFRYVSCMNGFLIYVCFLSLMLIFFLALSSHLNDTVTQSTVAFIENLG